MRGGHSHGQNRHGWKQGRGVPPHPVSETPDTAIKGGDIHDRIAEDYRRIFERDHMGNVSFRMKLLEVVLSRSDHFTVQELEKDFRETHADQDCSLLPDTLQSFVRYGLVTELRVDGQPVRYEHFHLHRHHDHAVCVSCGRIDEVDVFRPGWSEQLEEMTGYQILQSHIQLHGLCPECRGHRPDVFGLDRSGPGEPVEVVELQGTPDVVQILEELGIHPNARLQVIQHGDADHDSVVAVDDNRHAIPNAMLCSILVREVCRCTARHLGKGIPLTELAIGKAGKIVRICGRGPIRHRLLEMGITRGSRVFVERVAPLGDPIGVSIKGYCLAIRKHDAARIEVVPCE